MNWIGKFIWGIADDVLRDLCVRGKYRDVILPMMVIREEDLSKSILDSIDMDSYRFESALPRTFN